MRFKEFCKKYILRFPVIEIIVFALVMLIDQLSKYLVAKAAYASGSPFSYEVHVLGNFLKIVYAENEGAAWSFLAGVPWAPTFFLVMAAVAIPGFIVYLFFNRKKGLLPRISLALIIAGAAGNVVDRIFMVNGNGHVRDFISFSFFSPVFNIADSALSIGVCLFILYAIFDIVKDGKKQKAIKETGEAADGAEKPVKESEGSGEAFTDGEGSGKS